MTIASIVYGEKSEVLQHETVVYSNPQANTDPPNVMLNFTIPESAEVKEVKW